MRKTFTTAQLTAFLARPALLALEGVARQLGVKVPPEPAARLEERPVPSPEALATSEGVSSEEAVNGAPRGVGSRASAVPVVTRETSRPVVAPARAPGPEGRESLVETSGSAFSRGLAPTSPREGLDLLSVEALRTGGGSASPGGSGLHVEGASAPHTGPGDTAQRADSGSAMHTGPGATGQRTDSGSAMHAGSGAPGPRTVRVIRPAAPVNAKPPTPEAPGAVVPALPLPDGSTAAPAHGATPTAASDRRVVRLLPSKPSSTPAVPEPGDVAHNATSNVPPRTDAHPSAPGGTAPRRRLTFLPEGGSTADVGLRLGSRTRGMTGAVAPPEATASPAPGFPASESSAEEGAPSSGLTQPASRVSTSAIGAPATNVPLAVRAGPRSLDLSQPEPGTSASAAVHPHPDPRAGVPSFAPALSRSEPTPVASASAVERATPRQQAATGRLTEPLSASLTPVWEQAQRVSQVPLPVERVTTSSAQGAAVRNTFNVNVHLASSEAPAGMDRRSLEDALVDILRETARRHGLEV